MKRLLLPVAMVLAVSACAEPSPADPIDVDPSFAKAASKAVVHSAQGSGNITADPPGRVLTFTAKGHADGSFSGSILLTFPGQDITFHADVTCLRVSGNVAIIGGTADDRSFSPGDVAFQVQDNGEGANGAPDRVSLMYYGGEPGFAAAVCAGDVEAPTLREVFRGNVQVR